MLTLAINSVILGIALSLLIYTYPKSNKYSMDEYDNWFNEGE